MVFLLFCVALVGSSLSASLDNVKREDQIFTRDEVESNVNPFEEVVAKKRCTPEGGICAMHLNYGRCEYEMIRSQCPCTCEPDDNSVEDNSVGISVAEQTIFDEHNIRRRMHGENDLTYDTNLAASALAWCNVLAAENAFYHSDQSNNVEIVGENLYFAKGYGVKKVPAIAVKRWYDEISMWNYNSPAFSAATGHFTQVIWKDTKTVGCGVTDKMDNEQHKIFVCCHYSPPGNVYGQYAEQVPRPI